MNIRRDPAWQRATESEFKNAAEAFALLDLINAEFRSDPMSTQCFDASIVERVKFCVASHQDYERRYGFGVSAP